MILLSPLKYGTLSSNSPITIISLQVTLMPTTLPGAPLHPPDGDSFKIILPIVMPTLQPHILKESKRQAWKQVCMNLNPSSSIQSTWNTAKRFRNSILTHSRPHNDSWFDNFCCKEVPCYVPSLSEAFH
ncbi:Hypothetical protein CINCED_3A004318 [Cinara cedri]|uniref:Uncharacterized protein n=1 Tax=Cinara cedri TaxID=506608 RepID=A0A5E4N409_9HEMI|nr:Hypothetical protein CINCED_3A004318 [Cinara cedri]